MIIPTSNGPSRFCFDVNIIDDTIVESNEEFTLSFLIPQGNDAEAGIITTSTVTILDNDGASLYLFAFAFYVLSMYFNLK